MAFNSKESMDHLKEKMPMEVVCDHLDSTQIWDEVHQEYQNGSEQIQLSNYKYDLQLKKLKECL